MLPRKTKPNGLAAGWGVYASNIHDFDRRVNLTGVLSDHKAIVARTSPNWIKDAQTLNEIDETTPCRCQKSFAQKIFGSNLVLKNQKIEFIAKTQYAELGLAYETGEIPTCRIVVELYKRLEPFLPKTHERKRWCRGYGEGRRPFLAALFRYPLT